MSDLPPIRFANGACLVANEVTAPSGVKRIVFGDNPEKPMARLGYREVGRKACFAGMLFKNAPDEYKAGTSILSYFFETAIQKYINLLLLYFWLDMGWKPTQLRNIGLVLDYWCNE